MAGPPLAKSTIADPKSRYGDGRAATRNFLAQRVTGAINIVFVGFLAFLVASIAGGDRAGVLALLGNGWIGVPFALLFAIACAHMRIGVTEIVEDYVHDPRLNRLALTLNTFLALAICAVGAGAVLKIVFWG